MNRRIIVLAFATTLGTMTCKEPGAPSADTTPNLQSDFNGVTIGGIGRSDTDNFPR